MGAEATSPAAAFDQCLDFVLITRTAGLRGYDTRMKFRFRPQRYLPSCLNGHSSRKNSVEFIIVILVVAVTRSHDALFSRTQI